MCRHAAASGAEMIRVEKLRESRMWKMANNFFHIQISPTRGGRDGVGWGIIRMYSYGGEEKEGAGIWRIHILSRVLTYYILGRGKFRSASVVVQRTPKKGIFAAVFPRCT